jgi:RNA polymerase sigma-70 factor (ECF subfamily)
VIALEPTVTERPRPLPAGSEDDGSAAFDTRFAAGRERLVRICAGLVGVDSAEDVVQDAYLRGRSRFGQLRDVDLFDAWMTRIAINLCVNRQRRIVRLRDRLRDLASRPTTIQRDVGLRELIERLPPRERTVLVLHYGHGYRLEEIARLSGLSPTNVRSIIFRARRRLANELHGSDR